MSKLCIRFLVFCLISILLSSCAARLPERKSQAPNDIAALENGKARIHVYFTHQQGLDGLIFINDKQVSYVNHQAVIIDLNPGEYVIQWEPYTEREKTIPPMPLQINISENQSIYLSARMQENVEVSNVLLTALGGPVGGAIAGAKAKYYAILVEEPEEGPEKIKTKRIGDYVNLKRDTTF